MNITTIRLLSIFLLPIPAAAYTIPIAENLYEDSLIILSDKKPLLLMFSMDGCSYCETVEEEILGPMSELVEYTSRIIIRHIENDSQQEVINFDGGGVSQAMINEDYNVDFYPTVILVDHEGGVLEEIIGIVDEEFYWVKMDKAIESSRNKLIGRAHVFLDKQK